MYPPRLPHFLLSNHQRLVVSTAVVVQKAKEPVAEFVEGIRAYFDRALGSILLYRFERAQYEKEVGLRPAGTAMSDVYGPQHLLRVFVKLPALLAWTSLVDHELQALERRAAEFLAFLEKSKERYFPWSYYLKADDAYLAEYKASGKEDFLMIPGSKSSALTSTGKPAVLNKPRATVSFAASSSSSSSAAAAASASSSAAAARSSKPSK